MNTEYGLPLHSDILLRFETFLPKLRKTIGRKRFLHSVGTLHWAVVLATRHDGDLIRAATAGLLHDCGRLRTIEQVEAEFRRRGLDVPDEDLDETVAAMANRLRSGSRYAIRWTKSSINAGLKAVANEVIDRAAAYELVTQTILKDHGIGLDALEAKQRPEFIGE